MQHSVILIKPCPYTLNLQYVASDHSLPPSCRIITGTSSDWFTQVSHRSDSKMFLQSVVSETTKACVFSQEKSADIWHFYVEPWLDEHVPGTRGKCLLRRCSKFLFVRMAWRAFIIRQTSEVINNAKCYTLWHSCIEINEKINIHFISASSRDMACEVLFTYSYKFPVKMSS